jgi:hypothetical protein
VHGWVVASNASHPDGDTLTCWSTYRSGVDFDGEVWCANRSFDGAIGDPTMLFDCAELTSRPCPALAALSVQPRGDGFVAALPTYTRQRIEGTQVVWTTEVTVWSQSLPGADWVVDGVVDFEFGERLAHSQIAVLDDRLALAVQPSPSSHGGRPANGKIVFLNETLESLAELDLEPGRGPFLVGDNAVMVHEPALNGVEGSNVIELSAFDASGTAVPLPTACANIVVVNGDQHASVGVQETAIVLAHRDHVYSCDLGTGELDRHGFDERGALNLRWWPADPSNSLMPRANGGWLAGPGPDFALYEEGFRKIADVRNEYDNDLRVDGERLEPIAASVVPIEGGVRLLATAGFVEGGEFIAQIHDVEIVWDR